MRITQFSIYKRENLASTLKSHPLLSLRERIKIISINFKELGNVERRRIRDLCDAEILAEAIAMSEYEREKKLSSNLLTQFPSVSHVTQSSHLSPSFPLSPLSHLSPFSIPIVKGDHFTGESSTKMVKEKEILPPIPVVSESNPIESSLRIIKIPKVKKLKKNTVKKVAEKEQKNVARVSKIKTQAPNTSINQPFPKLDDINTTTSDCVVRKDSVFWVPVLPPSLVRARSFDEVAYRATKRFCDFGKYSDQNCIGNSIDNGFYNHRDLSPDNIEEVVPNSTINPPIGLDLLEFIHDDRIENSASSVVSFCRGDEPIVDSTREVKIQVNLEEFCEDKIGENGKDARFQATFVDHKDIVFDENLIGPHYIGDQEANIESTSNVPSREKLSDLVSQRKSDDLTLRLAEIANKYEGISAVQPKQVSNIKYDHSSGKHDLESQLDQILFNLESETKNDLVTKVCRTAVADSRSLSLQLSEVADQMSHKQKSIQSDSGTKKAAIPIRKSNSIVNLKSRSLSLQLSDVVDQLGHGRTYKQNESIQPDSKIQGVVVQDQNNSKRLVSNSRSLSFQLSEVVVQLNHEDNKQSESKRFDNETLDVVVPNHRSSEIEISNLQSISFQLGSNQRLNEAMQSISSIQKTKSVIYQQTSTAISITHAQVSEPSDQNELPVTHISRAISYDEVAKIATFIKSPSCIFDQFLEDTLFADDHVGEYQGDRLVPM